MNETPLLLVVDDEVDITETYAMYFELHGFEVMKADDPRHALELMSTRVPDLIISDCMMPYMDGVAFSKHVKADLGTMHIPIILMSGAPERHDLGSHSYEVFLRKPVLLERLLLEMRKLLKSV